MPPSASTSARKADFVGAIRLPSDAFKREGTAVVTDIVFLRKRAPGEPANHVDPDWLGVAPLAIDGAEVPVNRYFLNHPEMVLGTWSRKDTLYGGEGYSVLGNGDLAGQLTAAIHRLPEFAPLQASAADESPAPAFTPPPPERHITEGSFFVADDRTICQSVGGQGVPVVYGGTTLQARRHDDRQAPGRPGGLARPRPPRPAIAERRLARGKPRRRPPGTQPRLRPLRLPPTARSTRPPSAKPPTATSSAACPTWSSSAKTRTPCWSCRWKITTR